MLARIGSTCIARGGEVDSGGLEASGHLRGAFQGPWRHTVRTPNWPSSAGSACGPKHELQSRIRGQTSDRLPESEILPESEPLSTQLWVEVRKTPTPFGRALPKSPQISFVRAVGRTLGVTRPRSAPGCQRWFCRRGRHLSVSFCCSGPRCLDGVGASSWLRFCADMFDRSFPGNCARSASLDSWRCVLLGVVAHDPMEPSLTALGLCFAKTSYYSFLE